MVIHTTVITRRLGCEVTQSAFLFMFQNWNRWRHRQNYLREMEFATDVEGYTESWRGPECQGRHIPSEGLVSGGVLWHQVVEDEYAIFCLRLADVVDIDIEGDVEVEVDEDCVGWPWCGYFGWLVAKGLIPERGVNLNENWIEADTVVVVVAGQTGSLLAVVGFPLSRVPLSGDSYS